MLLFSAHSQSDDVGLAKAAELAATNLGGEDTAQKSVLLAVQKLIAAIDSGASAVKCQKLLVDAVRSAEQWVRCVCRS